MNEENKILKKQIEINPITIKLNAQILDLKNEIRVLQEYTGNDKDSIINKLSNIESI